MNKIKIGKTQMFLSILIISLILIVGCATTHDFPLPSIQERRKSEVMQKWGLPTDVYTESNKLKYGADEVWIYKNPEPSDPSLVEERLYFKEGVLIKREGITLDSF